MRQVTAELQLPMASLNHIQDLSVSILHPVRSSFVLEASVVDS